MVDVSRQTQSIFQPIDSPDEVADLLGLLVSRGSNVHIKAEPPMLNHEATFSNARATAASANSLRLALHDGPPLSKGLRITIQFDSGEYKFFSMGTIIDGDRGSFTVVLDKLHRLQRRNSFRVKIHQEIIPSNLWLSSGPKDLVGKQFTVGDLSIGGVGLLVSPLLSQFFEQKAVYSTILKVGKHSEISAQIQIRYKRPVKEIKGASLIDHIGCEFYQVPARTTDQIGYLVNECHRLMFLNTQRKPTP